MTLLITGGFGFIGSAVIRHFLATSEETVINLDCMTYAASPESLGPWLHHRRHIHIQADICEREALRSIFATYQPRAIVHLAAESHVDRSIDGPAIFVRTNILGTAVLLEEARAYWSSLPPAARQQFRFHHVSTDEVFGSLPDRAAPPFTAQTRYDPRSPYSATKAASDHLVRAWYHTYGLPCLITNTTNNYGPFQFPEKLIPLITINALEGKPLPVYGDGSNIRDWIHVQDHAEALIAALQRGAIGATYCFGARQERTNLEVVRTICAILDRLRPDSAGPRQRLITFVPDRPGHDFRYAMDPSEAERALGWRARRDFETGLMETILWYLDNEAWWRPLREKRYSGERLGGVRL